MQLRYLQTLADLGAEQNPTVGFLMPIGLIGPLLRRIELAGKQCRVSGGAHAPQNESVPTVFGWCMRLICSRPLILWRHHGPSACILSSTGLTPRLGF